MYCPKCGKPDLANRNSHEYRCRCGFHYFQNVAAAVAALIQCGNDILVATRARDPGKGRLDFPGGFVDPGETLENALRRELAEELGFNCEDIACAWLGSAANIYVFDEITYNTCDAYFHIVVHEKPTLTSQDDIAGHAWIALDEIDPDDFAFSSSRQGLRLLRAKLSPARGD